MDRRRHLAVLRRLVTSVAAPRDTDAMLRRTLRSLTTLTGHELSSLHLLSSDGRTLPLRGEHRLSARLREVNLVHLPGEGLIGRVAASGQAIGLRHVSRSPHLLRAARGVVQAEGIQAFACVPIRSSGRLLGTISVGRRTPEPFTAEDLRLLEVAAGHVGGVLEWATAEPDPPPEIRTRHELLAALVDEVRRSHQSMLGWARLLQAQHPAESSVSAHGLHVLERALARQGDLLGDLQDLSQIVAGTLPCDRRPIDLVATLEDVLAACRAGEGPLDVELITEVAACPVVADERRLRRVLSVVVADTAASGGTAQKVVIRLERRRHRARIAVSGGPAMRAPAPVRPSAFPGDPFGELGPEGIELAIARHVVGLHGGTLARRDAGDDSPHAFILELPTLPGAA
jgi:signal transduction histidine kinase